MHQTYATPEPLEVSVEIQSGDITVTAADVAETTVEVTGERADEVRVEHGEGRLLVLGPRGRFGPFRHHDLRVRITAPHDSVLSTRTGSADVVVTGRLASAILKSGSGLLRIEEVTGDLTAETGSGDVVLDRIGGEVRARSGSGDLAVESLAGVGSFSTGSGDIALGEVGGPVRVKTGSGDLRVRRSTDDVVMATGSGSGEVRRVERGRVQFESASGDLRLCVPHGVPVWTDISTTSGHVRSDLTALGAPKPGQDHVEVRAVTHSGDVVLSAVAATAGAESSDLGAVEALERP